MNENKNEKKAILFGLKDFLKKNSTRIKAGTAAVIVAGGIGIFSHNLNQDDKRDLPDSDTSTSQVILDPDYDQNDYSEIVIPTPGEEEHNHPPVSGETENNNENENLSEENENQSENLSERENPSVIGEHKHQFSDWSLLDEDSEVRECSCGEKEYRQHTLEHHATYEEGENDTHLIISTEECSTCDYKKTVTTTKDCNYILHHFDEKFEYRSCEDCGKEIKREHTLDEGTINEDGTITYRCLNDNCEYVAVKENSINPEEHVHNYGPLVVTYTSLGEQGHIKISTQVCSEENCPTPILEVQDEVASSHVYQKGVNTKDPITGKNIVIYTCKDCRYEKVVEQTKTPISSGESNTPEKHTHNYNGEPTTYYKQTDEGHIIVSTYTCIDPNCPNLSETKVEQSNVIAHSYDRNHGEVSKDGLSITYSCVCGKTKTESLSQTPIGHQHAYGNENITYENITETGHTIISTKTCTDPNCPNPEDKEITRTNVNHSYDNGISSTQDGKEGTLYTCSCGHTHFQEKEIEPPKPIETVDLSNNIKIDEKTLELTYNGQEQIPTLILDNLPEGVTVTPHYSITGTDAGDYTCTITFDVPDGYKLDPIEVNYTIKPADVTLKYEYKDGQVIATYSNIFEEDIVNKNYSINGEDVGTIATLDAGIQKVESSIEIDPEKLSNYNFSEDLNQSVTYNVKNQNNWFELDAEYGVDDNGAITLSIYLSNDKLPYYEDSIWPYVNFSIYFDNEQLTCEDYTYNDEFWLGDVDLDFPHDKEMGIKDGGFYCLEDQIEERITGPIEVCSLTFTINEGHENDKDIVITIGDKEMSPGRGDEIDFAFTSGATSYIINPSGNIQDITRDNDIMADATHTWEDYDPDDEKIIELVENGKELLQEYINNGYNIPIEDEDYYNNIHKEDDYYWEPDEDDDLTDEIQIDEEEETIDDDEFDDETLDNTDEVGEEVSEISTESDDYEISKDGTESQNETDATLEEYIEEYLNAVAASIVEETSYTDEYLADTYEEISEEQEETETSNEKVYTLTLNNNRY